MKLKNSVVMINNKFEQKTFLYDRLNHRRFDINSKMFELIKEIHNNSWSYDEAVKECDKDTISFLIESGILTIEPELYIKNIKNPATMNNTRIFMEVTDKCNLNCKHCYGGFATQNKSFISIDKIKKVIKQAEEINVYEFDLTGGEPLLYPNLEILLKELYDAGMLVAIFTNLVLLTDSKIELLKKYGVKKIITSLDSCKANIHDDFRGMNGCFAKTIESINKLKEHGFEVAINTMVGSHNLVYIDEQIEFLKTFDVPFVLDVIVSEGRAMDLDESIMESSDAIRKIIEQYKEDLNEEDNFKYCGIGDRFIYIKSNGNIYICPSLIESEFCIGSINEDFELKEIWSSMIDKYKFLNCKDKDKFCKKCKGGCRARAYKLLGDINARDDVYCNIIKGCQNV